MKYIHPKRIVRKVLPSIINTYNIWLLKYQAEKYGISLAIGKNVVLRQCRIWAEKKDTENELYISDGADLCGARFMFWESHGCIRIGKGKIAGKQMAVSFKCGADSMIMVEDGFLFSHSIDLCTTDWHPVYDECGNRINPNKDIIIEKDCWIARRVYIGKGVHLPQGTIVGAYAVVTKSFIEKHTVIAGNPATVKKRNIYWTN